MVQLVAEPDELPAAAAALAARRGRLASPARAAAFTSADPAADVLRMETAHEVDLVLLRTGDALDGRGAAGAARPAAAARGGRRRDPGGDGRGARGAGIAVPFAGGDHDWAAVETAAWFALATGQELRLVGARSADGAGRRDASRLLADASLAIQRLVGVDAVPRLVEPGVDQCSPRSRARRWWSRPVAAVAAPTVSAPCAAS